MKKSLLSKEVSKLVSKEDSKKSRKDFLIHNLLLTYLPTNLLTECVAFTMAEILLSLTIIGVVAAITLPSLTGNINERTWATQRKALHARFSQAIALMPALNGYGTLSGTYNEDGTQTITTDTAAETFITNGLSKVLKINNICSYGTDGSSLFDCGFSSKLVKGNGIKTDTPTTIKDLYIANVVNFDGAQRILNTKAAAFETANGESIIAYYNPTCKPKNVYLPTVSASYKEHPITWHVCANFVYDLNGTKGPNTFGKDIGVITAFYPTDSVVVAPKPFLRNALNDYISWSELSGVCKEKVGDEYRVPNLEEMEALIYNANIVSAVHDRYWSTTTAERNKPYIISASGNSWIVNASTVYNTNVLCVER